MEILIEQEYANLREKMQLAHEYVEWYNRQLEEPCEDHSLLVHPYHSGWLDRGGNEYKLANFRRDMVVAYKTPGVTMYGSVAAYLKTHIYDFFDEPDVHMYTMKEFIRAWILNGRKNFSKDTQDPIEKKYNRLHMCMSFNWGYGHMPTEVGMYMSSEGFYDI